MSFDNPILIQPQDVRQLAQDPSNARHRCDTRRHGNSRIGRGRKAYPCSRPGIRTRFRYDTGFGCTHADETDDSGCRRVGRVTSAGPSDRDSGRHPDIPSGHPDTDNAANTFIPVSVGGMRLIRDCRWRWLTQLRANRLVNPDRTGNRAVRDCAIAETGTVVHLKDYGMVRVVRIVTPAGDTEYWATNDLERDEGERLKYAEFAWGIEVYHRALKQECGVERAMVRAGRAQRNHIGCAIRAFVRLEWHRLRTGIGGKLAKEGIIRHALRSYLARPWYTLPASA